MSEWKSVHALNNSLRDGRTLFADAQAVHVHFSELPAIPRLFPVPMQVLEVGNEYCPMRGMVDAFPHAQARQRVGDYSNSHH